MEHYAAALLSQVQGDDVSGVLSLLEGEEDELMLNHVQLLQEPPWDKLEVTDLADIPGIKFNYTWLANLARFQLWDRFVELLMSLPGRLTGLLYPQAAFGLDYGSSVIPLSSLFLEYGGDLRYFFKKNSLVWLARRFSWSPAPDEDYSIEELRFSKYLLFSSVQVAWIALLIGIIQLANRDNPRILELRELYARIVLMSLFR
jgi:hypothetical protein